MNSSKTDLQRVETMVRYGQFKSHLSLTLSLLTFLLLSYLLATLYPTQELHSLDSEILLKKQNVAQIRQKISENDWSVVDAYALAYRREKEVVGVEK